MYLLNYDPARITSRDLQMLIDNEVPESRDIEYKRAISIGPNSVEKKRIKFLAGISSFANTDGGDLLIGIRAENGIPKEIVPIDRKDVDPLKLAIEQLVQTGISPRMLPGVFEIRVSDTQSVLLVRTVKSWALPHRVTLAGNNNFYGRHSAGMFPMDVDQVRAAFLASGDIYRRVRAAHQELLAAILTNPPLPLDEQPWVILHLIPFESLDETRSVDLVEGERDATNRLAPVGGLAGSRNFSHRFNFDGIQIVTQNPAEKVSAYTQLFRSGIIESVDTRASGRNVPSVPQAFKDQFLWVKAGTAVVAGVQRFLDVQRRFRLSPPIAVIVVVAGARDCQLHPGSQHYGELTRYSERITRDPMVLPTVQFDSFDTPVATKLQPVFDALWNAAGWPREFAHYIWPTLLI
jgi:hypothetical protein